MKHFALQHPKQIFNHFTPFFQKSHFPQIPMFRLKSLLIYVCLLSCLLLYFSPTLPIATFVPSGLPNSSHIPSSQREICGQFEWFWWLGTGYRYLRGFAHSMGLQHPHHSGLQNCCKARRQTFDCHAVALVRHSRPHTAQPESVTLLLTSLFQIRAKKAGWLTCSSASA